MVSLYLVVTKEENIIKGSARVLGAHVADTLVKMSREDQQNRSLYATQVWGKSDLGEIPFMQAFWEVLSSRG